MAARGGLAEGHCDKEAGVRQAGQDMQCVLALPAERELRRIRVLFTRLQLTSCFCVCVRARGASSSVPALCDQDSPL